MQIPKGRSFYHRIVSEPLILIPVTAEDAARAKRRKVMAWIALLLTIAAAGAWIYKRSTDPLRAQQAFDAAQGLFGLAHYEQAIVACDRAIALRPDFTEAFILRGRSHVAMYDVEQAIPDFTRAMEIRPRDPQALLERGQAYLDQKNYRAAIADADAAISIDPKDPKLSRAYNLRGTLLRALGDPQKAIAAFDSAVELEPNSDNYYQRGATYQLVGDYQHAISDFTQAISLDPDRPAAYFARAEAERALGHMEQAQTDHAQGRYLDGR
jgi:tetratricopeptide (TPR) repeat protein